MDQVTITTILKNSNQKRETKLVRRIPDNNLSSQHSDLLINMDKSLNSVKSVSSCSVN